MKATITLLPGDGIGPEVIAQSALLLGAVASKFGHDFSFNEALIGGIAIDKTGNPLPDETLRLGEQSDAILMGAVGLPKYDAAPIRPEQGLLKIRKHFGLFANLRPVKAYPALAEYAPLKAHLLEGVDMLFVRELTGGVYFGAPRGIEDLGGGEKRGVDTQVYTSSEIRRVARVAFELARKRGGLVHSAEKSNVMETGLLWREEVTKLHAADYADVKLEHILADNCAMQLVRNPRQFDVIVTDNLFGDVLSDEAAMMTGSLGMLPSASLGAPDPKTGKRKSLYEPVHGSAPDIAGKGLANPIATIASFAMALRYSLDMAKEADLVDQAIADVLASGLRTGDIMQPGMTKVGTTEMGKAIASALEKLAA